jgi:hypothetical protein
MTLAPELSIDDLLATLNWNPERDYRPILGPDEFPSQNRVAMISPAQHGKTTTVAGLFMRATRKVGDTLHTDCKFKARPLERASTIYQDVSDLSMGLFPAKTQTFLGFQSSPGLLVEQFRDVGFSIPLTGKIFGRDNLRPTRGIWHKARQISFNDLPGETLSQVQWQYRIKRERNGIEAKQFADLVGNAIMEMRNCQEFMFILNCAKAQGLGLPIEEESDPNVSRDPDVSQVRQLDDIAQHKAKHGERIKEIYVILASWDKLEAKAKDLGFDMFDPNLVRRQNVLEEFTRHCFFQFFGMLHSCGIPQSHIHYYPTYFQTMKDKDGLELKFEDPVEYMKPDGSIGIRIVKRPHIMVKDIRDSQTKTIWQNVRAISHSEETFEAILDDVMLHAPTVKSR